MLRIFLLGAIGLYALTSDLCAETVFIDRQFQSKVFKGPRDYRLFLPPKYEADTKRYPVIYYFHGHSDRYTLERYDDGKDTVPKIARFVAKNDVIVVAVDGYVKKHYEGFYGGNPWDVRVDGGEYDFGEYFLEMVSHVDAEYRTLTTRRSRATSGLSMGGFMSLYLSARYPELVGSASSFNSGPEFFTGAPGTRMLWRPKDHVLCHMPTQVRLIRASGDYISQYHEETHAAYAHAGEVDFEYRLDEYHRHWATSIGETFAFHLRAFNNPKLDAVPRKWNYTNAYHDFQAWDYDVKTTGNGKAFVYLQNVEPSGLRVTTRQWAPDGPPEVGKKIAITTGPHYQPNAKYKIADLSLADRQAIWSQATADEHGRLSISIDGAGHQISVIGPDVETARLVLLPVTTKDHLRLWPNKVQSLPLRIYNPSAQPVKSVRVELSSKYPTVEWHSSALNIPLLKPGQVFETEAALQVQFFGSTQDLTRTRLDVRLSAEGQSPLSDSFDVLVIPTNTPEPAEIEILDGRTVTFSMFRQKGNQGGGAPIERTVTEGRGNGDGVLQSGEEATIWVKTPQGLDPRDKNHWHRTKVYTDSPWLAESRDIQELKQREWTGAKERTSVVRLAKETPAGTAITVLLDNETWSFRYTPDVRYGKELLYQAFQEHRHHLHRYDLPRRASAVVSP